ncbi:hypothetical protein XM25_22155 [Devosia sp. H5989]|nr:hypothetical protein XM25_22155 [Devosia sp. H5989]
MALDMGGGFTLRQAGDEDHDALAMICLKTGDAGKDASAREDDPLLIGAIYALPYQVIEPLFAFVIEHPDHGVCGYVLGAPDTDRFYRVIEQTWYRTLRTKVADPGPDMRTWRGSDWARRLIHHPKYVFPKSLYPYPAHGHIDLLPVAQGKGLGGTALRFLMAQLAARRVTGIHLGVDPKNTGAVRFYDRLGFTPLVADDLPKGSLYMVKGF